MDDPRIRKVTDRLEKRIQVRGTRREPPLISRTLEKVNIDVSEIGRYMVWDVLLPALKETIAGALIDTISNIFGIEKKRASKLIRDEERSFVPYNSYYGRGDPHDLRVDRFVRSMHRFDRIIFRTREEAEEVLEALYNILNEYGRVSVSDFYAVIGEESDYSDQEFGWKSLAGSSIVRTKGGYFVEVPRTIQF